jgi:hypothetical protein
MVAPVSIMRDVECFYSAHRAVSPSRVGRCIPRCSIRACRRCDAWQLRRLDRRDAPGQGASRLFARHICNPIPAPIRGRTTTRNATPLRLGCATLLTANRLLLTHFPPRPLIFDNRHEAIAIAIIVGCVNEFTIRSNRYGGRVAADRD